MRPAGSDVAWVALGSNVGKRGAALRCLRAELEHGGARIEAASSEILTRPIGVGAQGDFHNQVVRLRSPEPRTPEEWLAQCRAAETRCGRRETYRWGPRRADADVVLLGPDGAIRVATPELTVPHPELANRPYLRRLLGELGIDVEPLA